MTISVRRFFFCNRKPLLMCVTAAPERTPQETAHSPVTVSGCTRGAAGRSGLAEVYMIIRQRTDMAEKSEERAIKYAACYRLISCDADE